MDNSRENRRTKVRAASLPLSLTCEIDFSRYFVEQCNKLSKRKSNIEHIQAASQYCCYLMSQPSTVIEFETSVGMFAVELYTQHAPRTCFNFAELAKIGISNDVWQQVIYHGNYMTPYNMNFWNFFHSDHVLFNRLLWWDCLSQV